MTVKNHTSIRDLRHVAFHVVFRWECHNACGED